MKNSISSFCAVFIAACLMVIVCFVAKAKNDGDIAVADAEHIEDVIATMKAECNVYDTNPNFESGCERIRTEFDSIEEYSEYLNAISQRPIDSDGFFIDDPNYTSYQKPENIVFEYKGMLYNLKGECLGEATNMDYTNELYESDEAIPEINVKSKEPISTEPAIIPSIEEPDADISEVETEDIPDIETEILDETLENNEDDSVNSSENDSAITENTEETTVNEDITLEEANEEENELTDTDNSTNAEEGDNSENITVENTENTED